MLRRLDRTESLTDRVAAALSEDITSGRYSVGDLLPSEAEMAKEFGVSRTVMREAISRLKADGLVTPKQGTGIFVTAVQRQVRFSIESGCGFNLEELSPIVELRQGFEVEAAGLAALRATPEDLAEMRRALDLIADALKRHDVRIGIEADVQFHAAICQATHNPYYLQLFDTFRNFLLDSIAISRENSLRRKPDATPEGSEAQSEHEALFEAIKSGSASAARLQARRHLENTHRRLVESAGGATCPSPEDLRQDASNVQQELT